MKYTYEIVGCKDDKARETLREYTSRGWELISVVGCGVHGNYREFYLRKVVETR